MTGPSGRQKNPAIFRVRMRRDEVIHFTVEQRIRNAFGWEVIADFPTRPEAQKYRNERQKAFNELEGR